MTRDDGRLELAKTVPIQEVAERLGVMGLRRITSVEMAGPCPVCGDGGKRHANRFSINTSRGVWHCRKCPPPNGGDGLALVRHVLGCDFPKALAFLAGEAEAVVDPAELARRKKKYEESEKRKREIEACKRAAAIRDGREIWHRTQPGEGSLVAEYLAGRGIQFAIWPPALRFIPDHPYRKHWPGRGVIEWMRGPCMVAGIQSPEGRVTAVHQTWIDPARPGKKLQIVAPDGSLTDDKGKAWPAKLVRGSKKGGAIRLSPIDQQGRMVMAEGIETTASAMMAGVWPGATFWAGVDLGNMAGRMQPVKGVKWSGRPLMEDVKAWLPPEWVTRLMFVQDGDSHEASTRAKLEAGAIRAMAKRPGLAAEIMRAEAGADLNDMLKNEGNNDEH